MRISAFVENRQGQHAVSVSTEGQRQVLAIPAKTRGEGSSVNGGELLFLALATCYCNDIYREAAKRNIMVESVEVHVDGEFGKPGEPAGNIRYRARIAAHASAEEIHALATHTDTVAEIQNTLRTGQTVTLGQVEPTVLPS